MKTALYSFLALATLGILATLATWQMSRPVFDGRLTFETTDTVEISPLDRALTFARTTSGDVILVLSADGSTLKGINLTTETNKKYSDAIGAYHEIGLETLLRMGRDGTQQTFAWNDLSVPVDEHYPHVAAGTNYRAHAREVGHAGEPFLFPKLSRATAWNADVVDGARLDYEVEICAVPLTDHTRTRPAKLAYLLCGDFTDRWSLVAHIDTSGIMGQTGFPIGKGGETRLPVGALLVVPEDADFYQSLDIALYVNDELRQRSSGGLMIWSPYEILSRTLGDCRSPYYTEDDVVSISDCEVIPARTLILTGTPEGVMFKVATIWNPLAYLRSGDVVVSTGKFLGTMRNEITRH